MRKKGIAAVALLGLALRLAVLAGAGEDLGRAVRARWGDGDLVRATLNVELGARGVPERGVEEADAEQGEPPAAAPAAEPSLLLVEVTPRPAPEAAEAPAEREATEPSAPEVRPADLSGGAAVIKRSFTQPCPIPPGLQVARMYTRVPGPLGRLRENR